MPGQDVLATNDHAAGVPGQGALVGWDAAPPLPKPSCGGTSCNVPLRQA
jgi:hypothetical protein